MTTDAEEARRKLLKKKFIIGGAVVGMLAGAGYAYLAIKGLSITGVAVPPESPGVISMHMFLILAACTLQGSIFGRLAGWLSAKSSRGK